MKILFRMKLILTVGDVFEISSKGIVVGGTNKEFNDSTNDEIRRRIGGKLRFQNLDGSIVECEVLNVDSSESLIGQKNIFLLVPATVGKDAIKVGAVVYGV